MLYQIGATITEFCEARASKAWDAYDLPRFLSSCMWAGLGNGLQRWFQPHEDDDGGGGQSRYRGRPLYRAAVPNREVN